MNRFALALLAALVWLVATPAFSQTSYFNQGFLRQPSAQADRDYLGITSGGSGSVTNFNSADFSPLFTASVTTPTTYPHLSYSAISQLGNRVYASPDGAAGIPLFRALTLADLPALPTGGSVTNFIIGDLPPLFTSTVTSPTLFPQVSFTLSAQNNNKFLAGPNGGGPLAPTFRSIATADLPDITSIVRGDVSASAPILYDSATGIFSMHVADASHDGYLSSGDWIAFNSKGAGTLTGITNASFGLVGVSLIATSNSPVPSLKSVSAGANVTITDNGTNLVLAASGGGGGGGSSGTDLPMTNLTAYANGTNFYIDFNWPAQTLLATGDIAFNYSTNFGLSSTSRVANVFVPATNYLRHVLFNSGTTNWHVSPYTLYSIPAFRSARLSFQEFAPGETNVAMTPFIDGKNDASLTNILDLSSLTAISSATNVLWVDATVGVFQDYARTIPIQEGMSVYGWSDIGGQGNHLTNFTSTYNGIFFHNASTAPFNIPCLIDAPAGGNTWLKSQTVTKLTQPVWIFIMAYSGKTTGNGANILDSLSGTTTRLLCTVGFQGNLCFAASANTSSFSVTNNLAPQWELFAYKFNSTTSQIRTNGVSIQTNNVGTGVGNGFTFGSDNISTVPSSTTAVAELAVFWGNLSAADLGNIETNYFRRKYGAW